MLASERQNKILAFVNKAKNASVAELTELLGISESTIRRDLTILHNKNRLIKVHGGAICIDNYYTIEEADMSEKKSINIEKKLAIGQKASELIKGNDFVYIDAGTTTEAMVEFIKEKKAVYVTNGIDTAKKLASRGFNVNLICGRLKTETEAIIGSEAIKLLKGYYFTLGFFGTNGISVRAGFTTPDIEEAAVKSQALYNCQGRYILADSDKLNKITAVSFAEIKSAAVITNRCDAAESLKKHTTVLEV